MIVKEAMRIAFQRGATKLFLCSRAALLKFHAPLGWVVLEEGIGPDGLTIVSCQVPTVQGG